MPEEADHQFDAVLKAVVGRAVRQKSAHMEPYDFRQGEKFSQDQKKFLDKIFTRFSDGVNTELAPLLQSQVQLAHLEGQSKTYRALLQSLPTPSVIITFKIDAETKGLLVVEYPLAFAVVDLLMGGKGQALAESRALTEIELAVFQRVVGPLLGAYSQAWKEVREVGSQFVALETNPSAVHIAPASEQMVVVTFKAQVAQAEGGLLLAVPFRHLKMVVPRSNFDDYLLTRSSQVASSQAVTPHFARNLESARVPVAVELGRVEILFQDLLQMEVGDIVKLETKTSEPLRIKVNDRTKYLGRPGRKEGHLAVQVTKVVTEGDEEFEE